MIGINPIARNTKKRCYWPITNQPKFAAIKLNH